MINGLANSQVTGWHALSTDAKGVGTAAGATHAGCLAFAARCKGYIAPTLTAKACEVLAGMLSR